MWEEIPRNTTDGITQGLKPLQLKTTVMNFILRWKDGNIYREYISEFMK